MASLSFVGIIEDAVVDDAAAFDVNIIALIMRETGEETLPDSPVRFHVVIDSDTTIAHDVSLAAGRTVRVVGVFNGMGMNMSTFGFEDPFIVLTATAIE